MSLRSRILTYPINQPYFSFLTSKVMLPPVSVIDLLPFAKSGFMSMGTIGELRKIASFLKEDLYFDTNLDFIPTGAFLEDEEIVNKIEEEFRFVVAVSRLFKCGLLNKDYHSIYNLFSIFSMKLTSCNFQFTETLLLGFKDREASILEHPEIDPLLLSISVKKGDLLIKYLDDLRSSSFDAYNFCIKESLLLQQTKDFTRNDIYKSCVKKDIKFAEIIKKKATMNIFLCKQISNLNIDVCKYITILLLS